MTELQPYLKLFSSLNRAPGPMWGSTSKCKAPHKPILLLAMLNMVERGVITSPFIDVTFELVELNELFHLGTA